jgi:hypothetical protein
MDAGEENGEPDEQFDAARDVGPRPQPAPVLDRALRGHDPVVWRAVTKREGGQRSSGQ